MDRIWKGLPAGRRASSDPSAGEDRWRIRVGKSPEPTSWKSSASGTSGGASRRRQVVGEDPVPETEGGRRWGPGDDRRSRQFLEERLEIHPQERVQGVSADERFHLLTAPAARLHLPAQVEQIERLVHPQRAGGGGAPGLGHGEEAEAIGGRIGGQAGSRHPHRHCGRQRKVRSSCPHGRPPRETRADPLPPDTQSRTESGRGAGKVSASSTQRPGETRGFVDPSGRGGPAATRARS